MNYSADEWEVVEEPNYYGGDWKVVEERPRTKGWRGVAQDVTGSGAEFFRDVADLLTNPETLNRYRNALGEQVGGAAYMATHDPKRAAMNLYQGAASGMQGLINAPSNIYDYLARKEIISPEEKGTFPLGYQGEKTVFPQLKQPETGDIFLQKVTELLPYIAGGEVGLVGAGVPRKIAQRAGAQSLHSIGQNEDPVKAALAVLAGEGALKGGKYLEGIGEAGGKGTAQLINKIKNMNKGVFKPEYKDIMRSAEKYGVDVFPADIATQKGVIPFFTELSEKAPGLNTVGAREAQMKQAKGAAGEVLREQEQKMTTKEFGGSGGIENLKAVAEGNSHRAPAAKALLENIENSGEDWNRIIQTSGNVSLFNRKLKADELSDKVTSIANQYGNVPEPHTTKAIDDALNKVSRERIPDQATVRELNKLKESLGQPQNYDGLRQFRRRIGNMINDYYTGKNALIGSDGVQYLQQIKNAVERDMDVFAMNTTPELKKAFMEFNHYYKKDVIPFKDKQVASALKNADADAVYEAFIKRSEYSEGKGHSRAKRFYDLLEPKGKEAVKTGLLQKAVEHGTRTDGSFSPALFSSFLEKNQPALNFFKGAEKKDIDGFVKMMRAVEKSGQMKLAETGAKAIPYILASLLMTHPAKAAVSIPLLLAVQKMMTSPKFAKFLAASKEKAPKMDLSEAKK